MERVRPSKLCGHPQNLFLSGDTKIKKFDIPLSNLDIITLHSIFMNPSCSIIQVTDVLSGRIILQEILNSLKYFHNLAYLSVDNLTQKFIINIFKVIQKNGQVHGLEYAIEKFFIEYIHVDFIWVELSPELIAQLGQSNIEYFLKIMSQHKTIPIIVINYQS